MRFRLLVGLLAVAVGGLVLLGPAPDAEAVPPVSPEVTYHRIAFPVMGGVSCNGWRFFSLQTDDAEEPKPAAAKQSRTKTTQAAKKPARGVKPKPASEAEPAHDEPVDEQASEPVVNEEVTAD